MKFGSAERNVVSQPSFLLKIRMKLYLLKILSLAVGLVGVNQRWINRTCFGNKSIKSSDFFFEIIVEVLEEKELIVKWWF